MSIDNTRLASADRYTGALRQLTARQGPVVQLAGTAQCVQARAAPERRPDRRSSGRARKYAAVPARDRPGARWRLQRNAVGTAEAALGSAGSAMQDFRTLVIQAGNGALNASDRASIAQQLTGLRAQLFELANSDDSNGLPLFAGLGSSARPFTDAGGGVAFDGLPGQAAAGAQAVPATFDGHATWMDVPSGNGVFSIGRSPAGSGVYSDAGQVVDPSALTGHGYRVQFAGAGGTLQYDVIDHNGGTVVQSGQPYQAGKAIVFDGLSLTPNGIPADGDALVIEPSRPHRPVRRARPGDCRGARCTQRRGVGPRASRRRWCRSTPA